MFELTDKPIDPATLQARLSRPDAGACVTFDGRVRNHHLGRAVEKLEYEAFDEMALAEGNAITSETEQLYPGTTVLCVHRTGSLAIGEVAVWIGVASAHRQAGFAACRHVIEEIKRRLPVWKKEHHADGAAEWVNCTVEAAARTGSDIYHERQRSLPEVGAPGQEKLANARALIVGVGGLGCPAALYLAGAGVGRITLVDSGRVELSNLHRQILFTTAEVDSPKATTAAARLRLHNPHVGIVAVDSAVTAANVRSLVAGQDVVLDCTDNFAARYLIHDACHALGIPLVSAAVHRFEGTLDVFERGAGGCLHCISPDARPADHAIVETCEGGPVFGPAVGALGVMQAAEAIKVVLNLAGDSVRQTRLLNLLDQSQYSVERPIRTNCPVCGRLDDLSSDPPPADAGEEVLVDAGRLVEFAAKPTTVFLMESKEEAREPAHSPGANAIAVPAHDLARLRELAAGGPIVLTCRRGLRSAALARMLRSEGIPNVFALTGETAARHDA